MSGRVLDVDLFGLFGDVVDFDGDFIHFVLFDIYYSLFELFYFEGLLLEVHNK